MMKDSKDEKLFDIDITQNSYLKEKGPIFDNTSCAIIRYRKVSRFTREEKSLFEKVPIQKVVHRTKEKTLLLTSIHLLKTSLCLLIYESLLKAISSGGLLFL